MAGENLQMPVANQAAADRASVASRARMQSNLAMSSGQAMMSGPAVAQKAAGVQAQEQGQIAAQAAQAELKVDVGAAQKELHETELRNKEQQVVHTEAMAKRHTTQKESLNALGRDVKQELLDKNLQFDKTQREARFHTERQLSDFMTMKTQDQQALKNYEQSVKASMEKDIIMMRAAFRTLEQAEKQQFALAEHERDKKVMQQVAEYKKKLEAHARKQQKKKAGWGAAFGVIKVAAGAALIATGAGATIGTGLVVSGGIETATHAQKM